MVMPKEYLKLAMHYERAAADARDNFSRNELLTFAQSYRTLAQSTAVLHRSAKALEAINRRRKPEGRLGS
jgi:hypothetical protein